MTSRPLALALVALFDALVAAGSAHATKPAPAFSRETKALTQLLELSSGQKFSLVMDPGASRLVLMLEGAVLREYSVEGLEYVVPRVAFVWRHGAEPDSEWAEQLWQGGELDPPRKRDRIEFTAAPPDSNRPEGSVEVPVPPPAEEAIVVPERYFVRFPGGLALEIRPTVAHQGPERWRLGLADCFAALRPHPVDRLRLRLRLAPDDADSFYRSLPPDVSLVVLPPTMRMDETRAASSGDGRRGVPPRQRSEDRQEEEQTESAEDSLSEQHPAGPPPLVGPAVDSSHVVDGGVGE